MVDRYTEALAILDKAERPPPTDQLYMIRGSIYSQQQKFELAIENFNKGYSVCR